MTPHNMQNDLFARQDMAGPWPEPLGPQTMLLHGYALEAETALLEALKTVTATAPFRHMVTPGGFIMSVAMTNCGDLGWVSDRHGYRYQDHDPMSGRPWPPMPTAFEKLASAAAAAAGFNGFHPDACLINFYTIGNRLTLHQDKNERDFSHPIVSVSLGMPAVFIFGGLKRSDKTRRVPLVHGDVVVWGGADRLRYHGVLSLKPHPYRHPLLEDQRINLTFRHAG